MSDLKSLDITQEYITYHLQSTMIHEGLINKNYSDHYFKINSDLSDHTEYIEDTSEIEASNFYYLPPKKKLIVGRYAPKSPVKNNRDSTADINNQTQNIVQEISHSNIIPDIKNANNELINFTMNQSDPMKDTNLNSSYQSDSISWDNSDHPRFQPVKNVNYRLLKPRYLLFQSTIFFPIAYPINISLKEQNDPRGTAKDMNNAVHGVYTMPLKGYNIVKGNNGNKLVLYKIGPGAVAYRAVVNAMNKAGLKYTPDNNWNVIWAKRATPEILKDMKLHQKINHYFGSSCLGRKDKLHNHLKVMKRLHGDNFDIAPPTFIIPRDYNELMNNYKCCISNNQEGFVPTYICKPTASSCGRGIYLVKGLPSNVNTKPLLVQHYIGNPFLIDDRKFDFRIYVTLTSIDPIRLYIFDQGLVRFAAEKYPGPHDCLANKYMHLTNYSINKSVLNNNEYLECNTDGSLNQPIEVKWLLSEFMEYLVTSAPSREEGVRRKSHITVQMHDVIIKTILSVETELVCHARSQSPNGIGRESFELYGFDLMIDNEFKVHLIEVNIMPSLATGFSIDKAVKYRLLSHLLTLVGIVPHNRKLLRKQDSEMSSSESYKVLSNASTELTHLNNRPVDNTRYYYKSNTPHNGKSFNDSLDGVNPEYIDKPLLESFKNKNGTPTLSTYEIAMLIESDEEHHRRGGFIRIFPTNNTFKNYFHLFKCGVLRSNYILASWENIKFKLNN